jgi:outer membrane protein assembly factor BamB
MKSSKSVVFAVVVCLVAALAVRAAIPALNWPHFGYDDQLTSYAALEKTITTQNVKNLKLAWSIGEENWSRAIYGSPAVYNNRLFTTAQGQNLSAYDAETGDFVWQSEISENNSASQPVITTDGTLIYLAGNNPSSLYGLKASSGKKIWQAPISFNISSLSKVIPAVDETRNTVYLLEGSYSSEGKLFALHRKSGKVLWYKSKTMGGVPFIGNYVLLKGSWIFARGVVEVNHMDMDKLARINAGSKKVELYYTRPTMDMGWDVQSFAICNDNLIVVYVNGFGYSETIKCILCVYNISSSQIVWQKTFTTSNITGAVACNTTKNIIYVPTDPYLFAYNVKNGAQVWRYQGYGAILSPSVANGVVFFLSDTNLYAISETNKKRLFRYALGHEADATTQLAVANGMIYFSGSGGTRSLFALGFTGGPESPLRPVR